MLPFNADLEGKFTIKARVLKFQVTYDIGNTKDIKTPQQGDTLTVYLDEQQKPGAQLHLTWRGLSNIKRGRIVAEVLECITRTEHIARLIATEGL